jgi:hypothetical protein
MKDICSSAEDILNEVFMDRADDLRGFLSLCESPVEQILVVALYDKWRAFINTHFNRMQAVFGDYPAYDGIFDIYVELQKPITTSIFEASYRADLFIYLTRFWTNGNTPVWAKTVVEIDGHDFHDRTKEQASRDRQRDRYLTLDGYTVIRFTGSDVYNDPYQCAEEIHFIMSNKASDIFLSYWKNGKLEELILGPRNQ